MMFQENKRFWDAVRQALLMLVHAIEEGRNMHPTTSEIRVWYKHWQKYGTAPPIIPSETEV